MQTKLGIIGGSGIYAMDGLADAEWVQVNSPWGDEKQTLDSQP